MSVTTGLSLALDDRGYDDYHHQRLRYREHEEDRGVKKGDIFACPPDERKS